MPSDAQSLQDELIGAMSAERKILLSEEIRRAAWDLKAAWMRAQHPEMTDGEIQRCVAQLFVDAGS